MNEVIDVGEGRSIPVAGVIRAHRLVMLAQRRMDLLVHHGVVPTATSGNGRTGSARSAWLIEDLTTVPWYAFDRAVKTTIALCALLAFLRYMTEHLSFIIAISIIGGLVQALVAMRWYEPNVENPPNTPLMEAGLFFVVFTALFIVIGWAFSHIAAAVPPYSGYALLIVTPIGLLVALASAIWGGKAKLDEATRYLGAVFFGLVGAFPIILLLI